MSRIEKDANNESKEENLLERELALPATEIISHGWYHGAISRQKAENSLTVDGSFLVRDSASQHGNYVLSCLANGQPLHFVINKVIIHPDTVYEYYQYQFEDEAYETIPNLITSYVGSGKPISSASGARIQYPANRTHSLGYKKQVCSNSEDRSNLTLVNSESQYYPRLSGQLYKHLGSREKYPTSGTLESLKLHKHKMRSNSLTPGDKYSYYTHEKSASADGVIQIKTDALDKITLGFSATSIDGFADWGASLESTPPAKPPRMPPGKVEEVLKGPSRQRVVYLASGSDSGNGSGDSTQSSVTGETLPKSQSINKINLMSISTLKNEFDVVAAEEQLMQTLVPECEEIFQFNFQTFKSPLLKSPLNKPLESDILHHIKILIRSSGSRILAKYLTKADLDFFFHDNDVTENEDYLKQTENLELCLLPQGRQFRIDVIERAECLKLLIAVTIFTCQTDEEKANVINDWILLAIETKFALGNLFSFAVIMLGLCMSQVQSLDGAWNILRRQFTDNALMFESKLRPCFKYMNECRDPLPPNTTIPHLLPVVMFLRDIEKEKSNINNLLLNGNDEAIESVVVMSELMRNARDLPNQLAMFKRNSKTVINDLVTPHPETDNLLSDLFRTEFHAIFLWGSQGCEVSAEERYARLTHILSLMSQKLQDQ